MFRNTASLTLARPPSNLASTTQVQRNSVCRGEWRLHMGGEASNLELSCNMSMQSTDPLLPHRSTVWGLPPLPPSLAFCMSYFRTHMFLQLPPARQLPYNPSRLWDLLARGYPKSPPSVTSMGFGPYTNSYMASWLQVSQWAELRRFGELTGEGMTDRACVGPGGARSIGPARQSSPTKGGPKARQLEGT